MISKSQFCVIRRFVDALFWQKLTILYFKSKIRVNGRFQSSVSVVNVQNIKSQASGHSVFATPHPHLRGFCHSPTTCS